MCRCRCSTRPNETLQIEHLYGLSKCCTSIETHQSLPDMSCRATIADETRSKSSLRSKRSRVLTVLWKPANLKLIECAFVGSVGGMRENGGPTGSLVRDPITCRITVGHTHTEEARAMHFCRKLSVVVLVEEIRQGEERQIKT